MFGGLAEAPPYTWAGGKPDPPASSQAVASPRRCGRLAFHIQLPYSFLHFPYVESAIRFTHGKDFCGNCSFYPNTTLEVRSRDAGWSWAPFSGIVCEERKRLLSSRWGQALGWQPSSSVVERGGCERSGIRVVK